VLVRPTAPPMWLGLLVAAAAITGETLLMIVLKRLAPMDTFGVLYFLGALVVAIGWGTGLDEFRAELAERLEFQERTNRGLMYRAFGEMADPPMKREWPQFW
jgi:hypothetical protein